MAELQNDTPCDECGAELRDKQTVLGKVISTTDGSVLRSFFWPTCVGCYAADKGGYLSAVTVALIMKS